MLDRAFDTEVPGLDRWHGAKPFFFTSCDTNGGQVYFEWDVCPLTRQPYIPKADIVKIKNLILNTRNVIGQNLKFDVGMMAGIDNWFSINWPWDRTFDTLIAGHLLASNQPHDLTSMVMMYLSIDIEPFEKRLRAACIESRKIAKAKFPEWLIAREGLACMPSAKASAAKGKSEKDKLWKYDRWLPRAIAQELNYPSDHPWWTVLAEYGNADSATTLPLHEAMEEELKRKDLWEIYLKRLRLLPVIHRMESVGITYNAVRGKNLHDHYKEEGELANKTLVEIAKEFDYELGLPKSGNNGSLTRFLFGEEGLALPTVKKTDTGKPAFDKVAVEQYIATLPENSSAYKFISIIKGKRKKDTAVGALENWDKFKVKWVPAWKGSIDPKMGAGWYVLHSSLNPTGTNTLRFSSSNPNQQNASKQEEVCPRCENKLPDRKYCVACNGTGYEMRSLRYCLGPGPGREWWKCDAKNIELRIPAFEADEKEMVELFLNPDRPPYYGSYHILIFDTLHPEKFKQHGKECKKVFEATWYQWVKNGNFAVQYGAQEFSGTADLAYHVPGAQNRIQGRFTAIKALSDKMIRYANKHGYVETIPEKSVNPNRGYPLYCTRTKKGGILPTVPLSYHVQGTAMQWMANAMVKCGEYLQEYNKQHAGGYYMIAQVHDEIVFDMPRGSGEKPWLTNLPLMKHLASLMESGGNEISVPTPVSLEYVPKAWSEGVAI